MLKNKRLINDFQLRLIEWYHQNKRTLPWRENPDSYRTWISEIILQQTRVAQGIEYYKNFLWHFPNVYELAKSSDDKVLKQWEGLGYYSRARNLLNGAKQIAERGVFPDNYSDWLKIKGVGPYTAAAISSIVNRQPVAVVDGNVLRVLSRVFRIDDPINSTKGKNSIDEIAQSIVNVKNPGDHNQAIMELGATICKPQNPKCGECPLHEFCLAKRGEVQNHYPVKEKKVKIRNRYFHFLVENFNSKYKLQRRDDGDIWAGLYQFPLMELDKEMNKNAEFHLPNNLEWTRVHKIHHKLSHQNLEISFWKADNNLVREPNNSELYFTPDEIDKLAFPRPISNFIREYLL